MLLLKIKNRVDTRQTSVLGQTEVASIFLTKRMTEYHVEPLCDVEHVRTPSDQERRKVQKKVSNRSAGCMMDIIAKTNKKCNTYY